MRHRESEGWGSLLLEGRHGRGDMDMPSMGRMLRGLVRGAACVCPSPTLRGPVKGAACVCPPPPPQLRGLVRDAALVFLPTSSSRLGPGTSHCVSFLQRIPNAMLINLVHERLCEDECLRRVRLHSTVWDCMARRGCQVGGKGWLHLPGCLPEATEKVRETRSSAKASLWSRASEQLWELTAILRYPLGTADRGAASQR